MAFDQLAESRPRRLHKETEAWILDVERLVPLGEGVFRPKTEKLRGETMIMQFLSQHTSAGGLGRAAGSLMRDAGSRPNQAFEAVGDRWLPVFETPPAATKSAAPPAAAPPRAAATAPTGLAPGGDPSQFDAMIRALGALRIAHKALETRVDQLERRPL